jgi:hypothetical protein
VQFLACPAVLNGTLSDVCYVQVRTENVSLGSGGSADPEVIYNLFLIFKIVL